jgi:Transposase IS66 family
MTSFVSLAFGQLPIGQGDHISTRHWRPLTLFLRQAGAPLDNNLVERSLKRAVVHRENALFYRTLNGAQVGDLFMSLIHTCQLCGVNSLPPQPYGIEPTDNSFQNAVLTRTLSGRSAIFGIGITLESLPRTGRACLQPSSSTGEQW